MNLIVDAYGHANSEDEEYVIIGFCRWCIETVKADGDSSGLSDEIMGINIISITMNLSWFLMKMGYDYSNYPDDTDYERDAFYALGGDDYDSFKENDGSIDDMMDEMGY